MRLFSSYTAYSTGELGRAGNHGGLHTMTSRPTRWKQVGDLHLYLCRNTELCQIGPRTFQSARIHIGRDDLANLAPGQNRRQHASSGSDVKRHHGLAVCFCNWQRGLGDQFDVLPPKRRENAVVRKNAVVGRGSPAPQFRRLSCAIHGR
jgi:hypothetical protein